LAVRAKRAYSSEQAAGADGASRGGTGNGSASRPIGLNG